MIARCMLCSWSLEVADQEHGGKVYTAHWIRAHRVAPVVVPSPRPEPEPEPDWVPAKRNTRPIRRAK